MITNFKIYESKETNLLKEYAKYLIDRMKLYGIETGPAGRKLREFINTGGMDGYFSKNNIFAKKKQQIDYFKKGIQLNFNHFKDPEQLLDFDEFEKIKEFGLSVEEYRNSQKYNL